MNTADMLHDMEAVCLLLCQGVQEAFKSIFQLIWPDGSGVSYLPPDGTLYMLYGV